MKKGLFLILLFFSQQMYAAHFTFDSSTTKVYEYIFEFKLNSAIELANANKKAEPTNLAHDYLLLAADFLKIANTPNKKEFESYSKKEKALIEKLEKLKSTERLKLYALAEVHFHSAVFSFYHGDYFSGGTSLRKSFKLLKESKKKFPKLLIHNKTYGLIKVLVGSIPKKYRFVENLMGIDGDIEKGLKLIAGVSFKELPYEYKFVQKESRLLYSILLYSIKKNKSLSYKIAKLECRNYKSNLFQNYIFAMHTYMLGKNDELIDILEHTPQNNEVDIAYMDFLEGTSKIRKLDYSGVSYLKSFASKTYNKRNKYAAYKFTFFVAKINKDSKEAQKFAQLAKKVNPEGYAKDFDFKKSRINLDLLKVRLLFDGGYFQQAKDRIEAINTENFSSAHSLEMAYRLAAINQALGKDALALAQYEKVLKLGENSPRYFARNSAIEMGVIYIKLNKTSKAKSSLNKALNEFGKSEEYEKSLKQKAKALLVSIAS